ncbi:hypothetical protein HOLleu_01116 [Holothuria leucospilota]|uniref:Uncharacterized protein n=1 Tax=Holothuria leucospilota TaxID=206669 RepID=A0A9Q1CPI8_HOLLE|nr:hypothetical protein HOLleu_01116 [Holothuria leucospilota]
MPIVQVTVNNSCKVFTLLDSGSSNSFCSRALARRLGITGRSYEFELRNLNKSGTQKSEIVDLTLSPESGETLELFAVYMVDDIPIKSSPIETASYAHLSEILPMPAYKSDNVTVDLLTGQYNAEALVPLDVANQGSPTEMENKGLECSSWSQEDKLVKGLWDREHRKVDGHYELPIPWRDRSEPLPNNFIVAKSRLDNLYKKLVREDLYDRYNAQIVKLLEKGYAEEVPESELFAIDRTWDLPHHAVFLEEKPDKLRVVFDCVSTFKGKSLNDRCMQGPDMINKLLPVLLRFRQHSIAI